MLILLECVHTPALLYDTYEIFAIRSGGSGKFIGFFRIKPICLHNWYAIFQNEPLNCRSGEKIEYELLPGLFLFFLTGIQGHAMLKRHKNKKGMKQMNQSKAFIFDMDGWLFDTENLGIRASIEVGKALGDPITRDLVLKVIGVTHAACEATYRAAIPQFDGQRFFPAFAQWMQETVKKEGLGIKEGVKPLISFLREGGFPCALASSSPMELIEFYLERADMTGWFDQVVSGTMVKRSKPAPDIFLLAARKMGVEPEHCMVFEDSINGVKAGRAAGMRVCMVPDLIPYTPDLAGYVDWLKPTLQAALDSLKEEMK